jgi:hypothetical protein
MNSILRFTNIKTSNRIAANGLGLCVRAGNRSTKLEFITNVHSKNRC